MSVRGRDVTGVISQYTAFVKPAFDQFVAPSRKFADVIIPWARWVCALGALGGGRWWVMVVVRGHFCTTAD